MINLLKKRKKIFILILFFIFIGGGLLISDNYFKAEKYLADSKKDVEEEKQNHDFSIADAEDNTCKRGEKRCLEDVPQRCDTAVQEYEPEDDDEVPLEWHDMLEDGKGCSDMGKTCFQGECADDKNIEMFTQPQPRNINISFNKGGVNAGTIKAEQVIDKWERFNIDDNLNWDRNPYAKYPNAPEFYYDEDRMDEYIATSSNKVWVGDDLGSSISHCPDINNGENYSSKVSLPENGSYGSCGYTFDTSYFPRIDYGQNCHRDRWQAWGDTSVANYSNFDSYDLSWDRSSFWDAQHDPGIDIGTAYKDCLYSDYDGDDFDTTLEGSGICDPYNGSVANLDCKDIAEAATEGLNSAKVDGNPTHTPPPVHPNECIPGPYGNGVWDWYNQRPDCTYFEPGEFKRERVCIEKWPDCVPIDEGECPDFSCGGGEANIGVNGVCIHRETDNPCYCPDPPPNGEGIPENYKTDFFPGQSWQKQGYCEWSEGRSAVGTFTEFLCQRCNNDNNEETCNLYPYQRDECTKYDCSFHNPNECDCEWNDCQKGYKSCTDTSCSEFECVREDEYMSSCNKWECSGYDELGTCNERTCTDKEYPDGGCDYQKCTDIEEETNEEGEVVGTSCNGWDSCAGYDDYMVKCNSWSTSKDDYGTITSKTCSSKEYAGGCDKKECADMNCTDHEVIWVDMDCEHEIEVPDGYTYREAEDCCKRWYWKCSAGCVSKTENCYEGEAVSWRPDYKYAVFAIGDPDGDCGVNQTQSFGIKLFINQNSTPTEVEQLIKYAQDGLITPHYEYTEDEFDGKVEKNCVRRRLGDPDIKNIILESGKPVAGDDITESELDNMEFDFEEYLDDRSGKYIKSIDFYNDI